MQCLECRRPSPSRVCDDCLMRPRHQTTDDQDDLVLVRRPSTALSPPVDEPKVCPTLCPVADCTEVCHEVHYPFNFNHNDMECQR